MSLWNGRRNTSGAACISSKRNVQENDDRFSSCWDVCACFSDHQQRADSRVHENLSKREA